MHPLQTPSNFQFPKTDKIIIRERPKAVQDKEVIRSDDTIVSDRIMLKKYLASRFPVSAVLFHSLTCNLNIFYLSPSLM